MKILKFTHVYLFIFILFISSCSKEDDSVYSDKASVDNVDVEYSNIDLEILSIVNDYRASIGVSTLETMDFISSVAETHTVYMVETGTVNHDYFTDRLQDLMDNVAAKSVGENVAYGYTTAEDVVDAWLKSDSHREVIENPNYTHFGISTEENEEGRLFYTQIFIKR